jgi:hypothetical protein
MLNITREDKKVLHDVKLWERCRKIACDEDIKISVSSDGYDVDKRYRFINLHDLCCFLDGWHDE